MRPLAILVLLAALVTGCASAAPAGSPPVGAAEQRFPDIVEASATMQGEQYSFSVTVSSPYDTAERYADAFRVRSADGTEYGVRELTHDHATEQPFTRTLDGVAVPAGVTEVVVEGRDLANGWGGGTRTVALPPR